MQARVWEGAALCDNTGERPAGERLCWEGPGGQQGQHEPPGRVPCRRRWPVAPRPGPAQRQQQVKASTTETFFTVRTLGRRNGSPSQGQPPSPEAAEHRPDTAQSNPA